MKQIPKLLYLERMLDLEEYSDVQLDCVISIIDNIPLIINYNIFAIIYAPAITYIILSFYLSRRHIINKYKLNILFINYVIALIEILFDCM